MDISRRSLFKFLLFSSTGLVLPNLSTSGERQDNLYYVEIVKFDDGKVLDFFVLENTDVRLVTSNDRYGIQVMKNDSNKFDINLFKIGNDVNNIELIGVYESNLYTPNVYTNQNIVVSIIDAGTSDLYEAYNFVEDRKLLDASD